MSILLVTNAKPYLTFTPSCLLLDLSGDNFYAKLQAQQQAAE